MACRILQQASPGDVTLTLSERKLSEVRPQTPPKKVAFSFWSKADQRASQPSPHPPASSEPFHQQTRHVANSPFAQITHHSHGGNASHAFNLSPLWPSHDAPQPFLPMSLGAGHVGQIPTEQIEFT